MIFAIYLLVAVGFCVAFVVDSLSEVESLSTGDAFLCAIGAVTWPVYLVVSLLMFLADA